MIIEDDVSRLIVGNRKALLINPPIYDVQYWANWSQPHGLLKVATWLREQCGYTHLRLLDCLATDAHHGPAFPTLLLYNPHADERRVTAAPALPPGTAQRRVYDAVAQRFLPATAAAPFTLTVPPDGAIPAVFIPADAAVHMRNGRLCAGETVIDWHEGLQSP